MLKPNRLVVLGAATMLLPTLPALAKPKAALTQTATIENTGSTNTLGYKITIASDGIGHLPSVLSSHAAFDYKITMTSDGKTSSFSTLSGHGISPTGKPITTMAQRSGVLKPYGMPELEEAAQKLFADLDVAMPLTSLPVRHGMRSASFGTATFITYKGQKSPDLTFASDSRTAALKADIEAITKTLGVGNAPRRPIVVNQSNKPIGSENFKGRF